MYESPLKLFAGLLGATASAPVFRTAPTPVSNTSGLAAFVISGIAQPGDVGLLIIQQPNGTISNPACPGWTLVSLTNGLASAVAILAKKLTAADIGTTISSITWTALTGATSANIGIVVYSGVDALNPLTAAINAAQQKETAGTTVVPASADPTNLYPAYTQLGLWSGAQTFSITTPPSGMTQRVLSQNPSFAVYDLANGPGGQSVSYASAQTTRAIGTSVLLGGNSTQLATPTTVLYTVPASTKVRMKEIILSNPGQTGAAKVSMNIGGAQVLSSYTVVSGSPIFLSVDFILNAGDTIIANAGVMDSVSAIISGTVVS